MPPEQKYRLGDVLVDQGLISTDQLSKALEQQKTGHQRIGKTLVQMDAVAEGDLISALSRQAVFNQGGAFGDDKSTPASLPANTSMLRRIALLLTTALIAVYLLNAISSDSSSERITNTNTPPAIQIVQAQATVPVITPVTLTNNTDTTIHQVELYQSDLQQQFIFRSSRSLKADVQRQYGEADSVRYFFPNATLNSFPHAVTSPNNWIHSVKFEQMANGVLWTFNLIDSGSAKYHEIEPSSINGDYQFVVVIRKSST